MGGQNHWKEKKTSNKKSPKRYNNNRHWKNNVNKQQWQQRKIQIGTSIRREKKSFDSYCCGSELKKTTAKLTGNNNNNNKYMIIFFYFFIFLDVNQKIIINFFHSLFSQHLNNCSDIIWWWDLYLKIK